MRSLFIVLLVLPFIQETSFAKPDTLWHYQGVTGVNASQVSFNNWTQGGENSIAWTFYTYLGASYVDSTWILKNSLKLAYGRSKIGSANYRTNDNEFYYETVLAYRLGWAVDPFFSNSIRSSVATGFDYKNDQAVQVSDFFDPGYVTQSLGFTFNKEKAITTRLGLGLQEVFTNKYRSYTDDKSTEKVEAFKLDTGLESVTDVRANLDDNLLYQAKLRLFTRFTSLDVWDVRWDNNITAKVTKYLNVNFNVLVVYEKSQSPKTQLKEALQMGIAYSLF
jgi:hypothetical protein